MAFEKIGPFGIGERGKPEAVDDEQRSAGEPVEQLGIGAIGPRTGEIAERPARPPAETAAPSAPLRADRRGYPFGLVNSRNCA
jgi:hypothetical protein